MALSFRFFKIFAGCDPAVSLLNFSKAFRTWFSTSSLEDRSKFLDQVDDIFQRKLSIEVFAKKNLNTLSLQDLPGMFCNRLTRCESRQDQSGNSQERDGNARPIFRGDQSSSLVILVT